MGGICFNGSAITYDAIGNPLQYRNGIELTWTNGRKLASVTQNGATTTFTYDGDGNRIRKVSGNTTIDYIVIGGTIYGEIRTVNNTTTKLHYLFDENGTRIGFVVDGEDTYYYRFNLQGDVTGIFNSAGTLIVEYSYDAWGNPETPTGDTNIANLNPIRYRGYYYDVETGLYYLQTRYYDPVTCRFISADGLLSTGQGILGYNMYAYCGNNPVIRMDPSGQGFLLAIIVIAVGGLLLTSCSSSGSEAPSSEGLPPASSSPTCPASDPVSPLIPLTEEQKVLISTIAAEATVTATRKPVSSAARQAMANVALNRVNSADWKQYSTVSEICKYSGFDGYGNGNYINCMNYLNNRDGNNSTYEAIIWDVMAAYTSDITDGCQLYYTPAAMTNKSGKPNWNFKVIEEVHIPGVDPYYEGRFYRYR